MNLERAILLSLLAAKGDALSAADIRREAKAYPNGLAAIAEVEHALESLEESKCIQGCEGDREDAQGRPITVYTLLQKGRSRALK